MLHITLYHTHRQEIEKNAIFCCIMEIIDILILIMYIYL